MATEDILQTQRNSPEVNQHPHVSVITPAYNVEAFIGETIESVKAQTFTDWEMIIADDGSTDRTVEVAVAQGSNDPRIRVETYRHSGLPAITRNRALAFARGRLLAFLDADDLWDPHKLSVQLSSLKRHDVNWGFHNVRRFGDYVPNRIGVKYAKRWRPARPFLAKLLTGDGIPFLSVVVERKLLEQVCRASDISNAFDESENLKAVEDWDLALRLSQVSEPDYVPHLLACYRVHAEGISTSYETTYHRAISILEKYRRMDFSASLLCQAENLHLSKLSISRMLNSTKPWRRDLIVSCLAPPVSCRDLYLTFLVLLPKPIGRMMYLSILALMNRG